jgi:hypothetical protein
MLPTPSSPLPTSVGTPIRTGFRLRFGALILPLLGLALQVPPSSAQFLFRSAFWSFDVGAVPQSVASGDLNGNTQARPGRGEL